jgi:hypothetical protein
VRSWIPWAGFVPLLGMMWLLHGAPLATASIMLLLLAAYAVPVFLLDVYSQTRLPMQAARAVHFMPRFVGQAIIFAALLLLYWMFPYTRNQWLFPVCAMLGNEYVLPVLVLLSVVLALYTALTRVAEDDATHDATLGLGQMLLRQRAFALDASTQNLLLSWAVKGFFLPLMAMFMVNDIAWFRTVDWSSIGTSFPNVYEFSQRFLYFCDVTIALAGYLLTFRWAGTQIRSAEPSGLGWAVCLVCYPPFWAGLYDNLFAYENGRSWASWLWDSASILHIGWGSVIIGLTCIYLWATIAFGVRFSNLTHRGIITSGPYRFTKHPAYIAKNLSWWMISVPFLQSSGALDALRLSLLLLCVNGIYYARAKTEERHLMRDLVYRDYAAWIARYGLLAKLKRQLKFSPL